MDTLEKLSRRSRFILENVANPENYAELVDEASLFPSPEQQRVFDELDSPDLNYYSPILRVDTAQEFVEMAKSLPIWGQLREVTTTEWDWLAFRREYQRGWHKEMFEAYYYLVCHCQDPYLLPYEKRPVRAQWALDIALAGYFKAPGEFHRPPFIEPCLRTSRS